jgi:hypothetical protein
MRRFLDKDDERESEDNSQNKPLDPVVAMKGYTSIFPAMPLSAHEATPNGRMSRRVDYEILFTSYTFTVHQILV